MKKLTALIGMLLMSSAAQAGGLVSAMSSSVQLNVDAARTTATRIGNFIQLLDQMLEPLMELLLVCSQVDQSLVEFTIPVLSQ